MTTTAPDTEAQTVEVALVQPHPANIRSRVDRSKLRQLTDSVKARGILQPLLVRPHEGGYQVVAGHRRLAAAHAAGLTSLPVHVQTMDDAAVEEAMLIADLHHALLTPVEEARGYLRLVERDIDVKTLADRVGRTSKHVASRLRLLELPGLVLGLVERGELSLADADGLVGLLAEHPWHEQEGSTQTAVLDALTDSTGFGNPLRKATVTLKAAQSEKIRAEVTAKIEAKAAKAGYDLIRYETRNYSQQLPAGCAPLGDVPGGLAIDVKEHRVEPCHVLILDDRGHGKPSVIEGCNQRGRHTASGASKVKRDDLDQVHAERERRQAEQAERERLAALRLAADQAVVTRASKPEQTDLLVAAVLADVTDPTAVCAILGIDTDGDGDGDGEESFARLVAYADASKAAAWRAALAVVLDHANSTDWIADQVHDVLDPLRRELHPEWAEQRPDE